MEVMAVLGEMAVLEVMIQELRMEMQEVQEMPWGQTTAYVRLPEGGLIEICTAVQAP